MEQVNRTLRCNDGDNKDPTLLESINAHPFDEIIRFEEEGHIYWIRGDETDIVSSTTLIHQHFPEFNKKMVIQNIVRGKKWANDPSYKYYGMTYEEIDEMWAENGRIASEAGTIMHADIEFFYNGIPVENNSVEFSQFMDFYEDHKDQFKMYRTEWMICAEELRITGSIDAVFINPDGTLTLGDWKRSKGISKTAFRRNDVGYHPFTHMPNCNFSHYSLQLNLYRIILEEYYGKKIKEMFLVVCHPNNEVVDGKRYLKIMIPRLDREAKLLLEYRRREVIKKGYVVNRTFLDKVEDDEEDICLV
jgi:hypothetical protein